MSGMMAHGTALRRERPPLPPRRHRRCNRRRRCNYHRHHRHHRHRRNSRGRVRSHCLSNGDAGRGRATRGGG